MEEGAVAVYIRHRNELLKSIFEAENYEQEVGDYLLSLRNLENHNIEFTPNEADIICMSLSTELLKMGPPPDNRRRGRADRGFLARGHSGYNLARLLSSLGTQNPWHGRMKSSETLSTMHGNWPGAIPDDDSYYPIDTPFDKEISPIRRTNVVTGKPVWEQMLRDFYFSDDDSPSLAEQSMGIEDRHETHHLKEGSPIYRGITSIGDKSYPFAGSDIRGHESHGKHMHTARLRDFERWKKEQGDERLTELEKEGITDKELQSMHFDDRMEKLASDDTHTETVNPRDILNEKEIMELELDHMNLTQAGRHEEADALFEPAVYKHAHHMGHATWNMGMEWYTPMERTAIMEHIHKHGTDDAAHQTVKLPDGHRVPMSRIKKNMEARMGAEFEHWSRAPHIHGPNMNKHMESEEDTPRTGIEGNVGPALRDVDTKRNSKDEITGTAFDDVLTGINEVLGLEEPPRGEEDKRIQSLFPFADRDVKSIKRQLEKGKDIEDIMRGHSKKPEAFLSREGLLNLIGYDENFQPLKEHSVFGGLTAPFLDEKTMERVMKQLEYQTGMVKEAKPIRNAYGTLRVGDNGPRKEDLSAEQRSHYYDIGGQLRGLAFPFSRPFTHRGGLGRASETYREFIHNLYSIDGGKSSLFGELSEQGGINHRKDTSGLFSGIQSHPLDSGAVANVKSAGIISREDASAHEKATAKVPRNRKNDNHSTASVFQPETAMRLAYMDQTGDWKKDFVLDRSYRRDLDGRGMQHSNAFTRTGSDVSGDVGLQENASMSHRLATSLGRINPPHAPSERRLLTYEDMKGRPELLSSSVPHHEFLTHMGDEVKHPREALVPLRNKPDEDDVRTPGERLRWHVPKIPSGTRPSEGFRYNEMYEDLIALEEQLVELEETPERERGDSYNAQLRKVKTALAELQTRDYEQVLSQLKRSRGTQYSQDFEQKMNADLDAIADYAKGNLLPMNLEMDPTAYDPSDPHKALSNAIRLISDGNRGLLLDDNHGLSTVGYNIDEAEVESQQSKMGGHSPHKHLAGALQILGKELHPSMDVEKAIQELGLPNDDAHKVHVGKMLEEYSGPFRAFSMGQIARLGLTTLNPKDSEMFSPLQGEQSIYERMDEMRRNANLPPTKQKAAYRKAVVDFNAGNPAYKALQWLQFLPSMVEPEEMERFGLLHHKPDAPLFPSSSKKGLDAKHAQAKSRAGHIISFDENLLEGPLEGLDMGTQTKERMGYGSMPIRPLRDMKGSTVFDGYIGGTMDWGYSGYKPTIGNEFDRDGAPQVGQNMPQGETLHHSVQVPQLERVFGKQWVDQVFGAVDPSMITGMTSNQMTPNIGQLGGMASDNKYNVATGEPMDISRLMLKGDLPKQIPLIEPLHRIFKLKDLKQLRGFTGEWVVSHWKEGKRVKVRKKGNRVSILNEDGSRTSTDDSIRAALRKVCKKEFVIDCVIVEDELFIQDILMYEETDVTDLSTRERVKLLRGQFDSFEPVHVPSPSDIRVTDEVGLENAVKELGKESNKLLLRDAKSTYMKGEERHPKWVLLAKSEESVHIPFGMEIEDMQFVLHLPEDVVKYEIIDNEPVNPYSVLGDISSSDYSIRLAESLEEYWKDEFQTLLKEELEVKEEVVEDSELIPEADEERIEDESGGILRPKKDKNLILKPEMVKALEVIERILDEISKDMGGGHGMSWTGARGLGIDVGTDTASPRGPTTLVNESAVPDWDMKKRPTEDPEKPEDYGNEKRKTPAQSNDLAERSLES